MESLRTFVCDVYTADNFTIFSLLILKRVINPFSVLLINILQDVFLLKINEADN